MKKTTQKDRVLEYIKDFGSISSFEAFRDLGITRLSAVIYDLKKLGHRFNTTNNRVLNRYDEFVTYANYQLEA